MKEVVPMVSICIFTYNHEKYIVQCLESVLMQRTSFPIEIIIGEDYSLDQTRTICQEYCTNYSNISLIDRGRNVGMRENVYNTIQQARGKYVAILDGDDFWIHPLKLQKQYDYLEAHPDINLVFHQTIRICETKKALNGLFITKKKALYSLKDIIDNWSMATGSMFYRKSAMVFPQFLFHTYNFDLVIQMILLMDNSNAAYIDEIMSVYNINEGSNTNNINFNLCNTFERIILLMNEFNEYTNYKYNEIISNKIHNSLLAIKSIKQPSTFVKFMRLLKKVIYKSGYEIKAIDNN